MDVAFNAAMYAVALPRFCAAYVPICSKHAVARDTEIGFHRVEGSALQRGVTAKDSAGGCRQRAESAATTTATPLTPADSAARESLNAASKLEGIVTSGEQHFAAPWQMILACSCVRLRRILTSWQLYLR